MKWKHGYWVVHLTAEFGPDTILPDRFNTFESAQEAASEWQAYLIDQGEGGNITFETPYHECKGCEACCSSNCPGCAYCDDRWDRNETPTGQHIASLESVTPARPPFTEYVWNGVTVSVEHQERRHRIAQQVFDVFQREAWDE